MPRTALSPATFSREAITQFHLDGFCVWPDLATADDLAQVRELLDGLFDRFDELPRDLAFDLGDKKHHVGAQRSPQINSASQFEPRLKETRVFARCRDAALQLLGPKAEFRFDHSILKPPHNGAATPWHQDMSYGARRNPKPIMFNANFWIPLQDASIDSGCMQFIPHSHLGDLLPHHTIGHDPEMHTLETDGIDGAAAVACPVKAGGCTIHHGKTLHYTAANDTDIARRAWIVSFAVPVAVNWFRDA